MGIALGGGGGGGGPTSVSLYPGSAQFPDGSASNLAPQMAQVKSSAGAPTPYFLQLNFDAGQTEQAMWQFAMPSTYASDPVLQVIYKMASATTGDVRLSARLAAVSPGAAVDADAMAFGSDNLLTDTVPGTAGNLKRATIPLTNNDSVLAGDLVVLYVARLGADGADTAAGDLELVALVLDYGI